MNAVLRRRESAVVKVFAPTGAEIVLILAEVVLISAIHLELPSMDTPMSNAGNPAFYTVKEAAHILRVDAATLYRAIREDAFPAVRVRSRYVIPAAALDNLIAEVTESGGVVDPARLVAERRMARTAGRLPGGRSL